MDWLRNLLADKIGRLIAGITGVTSMNFITQLALALRDSHLSHDEITTLIGIAGANVVELLMLVAAIYLINKRKD